MVHVGEEVRFQVVLVDLVGRFVHPLGVVDYCVAMVGTDRIEVEPDIDGYFQFSYPFDGLQPGQEIRLWAALYRQRGGRDFMKIRGRWMQSDSPYEQRDQRIGSDAITLTVYEVPIEFTMVRPPVDLDPETGVMRIRRSDGSIVRVYIDKPGRPGFTITGPDPEGYYRIGYVPSGNDLNPSGTTEVTLTIYDRTGTPHEAAQTIETP
jgi:hypothetical protein